MDGVDVDDEKSVVHMMKSLRIQGQWQQSLPDQGFVTASVFHQSVTKVDLNLFVVAFVDEGVREAVRPQGKTSAGCWAAETFVASVQQDLCGPTGGGCGPSCCSSHFANA